MERRKNLSKFDTLGNFWNKIKDKPLIKQIYVIKEPELVLKIYDRFGNTGATKEEDGFCSELGEMFVETYADVPEYNEKAYFISVSLGGNPIKRMNRSRLVRSCEDYDGHSIKNLEETGLSSSIQDRRGIVPGTMAKRWSQKRLEKDSYEYDS